MKALELNTQEASNKWWAALDARQRNLNNASRYTEQQKIAAERMRWALELVYSAKNIYITYGARGISIKVDKPVVRDRKELRLLEAGWELAGIVKKVSAQGIIYRYNKA